MSKPELLLTVPSVELHQVQNQQDTLLHKDRLTLFLDQSSTPGQTSVIAQVAAVSWRLQKTIPCLKSETRTYVFSLPDQSGVFYCVILSPDTPPFVVESFEGVLRSSSDYSTLQLPSSPSDGTPAVPPTGTEAPPAPTEPSNMSKQVSGGLVTGSGLAAQGIVGLAGLTATGIQKLSEMVVKNTTPSPTGTMAPETKAKLDKATTMISQAGNVLKQLTTQATKVADTATRSVATSLNKNESVQKFNANPDVQVLGGASKAAGSQLLVGLKDAARIIGESTKAAVQQYKAHKYPAEAPTTNPATGITTPMPTATVPYPPPGGAPPPMQGVPTPFQAFPAQQQGPPPEYQGAPPEYHGAPPAGYPAVPAVPASPAGSTPAAAPGQPAAAQGVYPDVQQPTLYPQVPHPAQ